MLTTLSTYDLNHPFTSAGEPLSKTDMWDFDGYRRQRHRFEHSHLTTGMWATTGAWPVD